MSHSTVEIREATEADLMELADMFAKFIHSSNVAKVARIDAQHILDNLLRWVKAEGILTALSPHGFMIAFQHPSFYSSDLWAAEFSWWVDTDFTGTGEGKALKEYFEKWAKDNGCEVTCLGVGSAYTTAKTAQDYLLRDGYTICETNHMKRI